MKASKVFIWVGVALLVAALAFALSRPAAGVKKDIGNQELRDLVAKGARLIDVRSEGEYAMGHITGAENVPVETIQQAAESWDRSQPVVLYCATGARSATAATMLAQMGFKAVYNDAAGVNGWDEALTTEVSSAPGTIETAGKPVLVQFSSDG